MPRWSWLKASTNGSRSDSGYGDGGQSQQSRHSSTRQAAALAREAGVGKLILPTSARAMMTKVVSTCYVNVVNFPGD